MEPREREQPPSKRRKADDAEALNPEADPSTETAASEDSVAAAGAGEEAGSKLLQDLNAEELIHILVNETDRVRLANAIDAITVEHAIHEDIVTSAVVRLKVDAEEQKAQVMAHFEECGGYYLLSGCFTTPVAGYTAHPEWDAYEVRQQAGAPKCSKASACKHRFTPHSGGAAWWCHSTSSR